ncbi:predicted protein [Naegleria gruberi]|uniref:Predicted protein n=1 Tax=Naegleria gruberi TaxID=5762 RepID=D2VPY4_NAEGR|nr:uncharacterized protein NAEGRDRAFT_71098 [Naegleria gruberi]EFC41086.1 predicted protein [Naegleria gruberi]|eukprot:XP_002673830.1 predicted protein [Naegleria gruberi strain NEG-M]
MMKGEFGVIPSEIIFDQILSNFEYTWILNTVRLVCKNWNENYKSTPTFYFPMQFSEESKHLEIILTKHSDELHKITHLECHPSEYLDSNIEFISKLTNLKSLKLSNCSNDVIVEFSKLKTLENVQLVKMNINSIRLLFETKSKIKTLFIKTWSPERVNVQVEDLLFDQLDWPLERLFLHGQLNSKSYISIFESKFANKLKNFGICNTFIEKSIFEHIRKLESITDLFCLTFRNNLFEEEMKFISPLGNLKKFHFISKGRIKEEAVKDLSTLKKLEELHLDNNLITACNFPYLENMKSLNLQNNRIGNEGAINLCSLSNLTELNLSNNLIGGQGLKYFYKLSQLKILNLSSNQVGDVGANYLSENVKLENLSLKESLIGEEGLRNFGNLKLLKYLMLNNNKIGNGLKYLSNCNELEYLHVGSNDIGDESVIELFRSEFRNLIHLDISHNYVSYKCCDVISKMNQLKELNISNNPSIGDTGLSLLSPLSIIKLEANNCGVSDSGIIDYLNFEPKISTLHIKSNKLSNMTLQALISYAQNRSISELKISDSPNFDTMLKKQLGKLIQCIHFLVVR